MRLNIKTDIKPINKKLSSFQKKQIPFATSQAINKTAFQTRKQLQIDMDTTFRKGATAFTKRGVLVKKSHKTNLVGNVYINKEQSVYLERQVFGGIRTESFAIPIPFRNRVGLSDQGNLTIAMFKPKLLVALNRRSVTYNNPKFKFFALGRRAVKKFFLKNYRRELDKAIKSAKKK